MKKKPRRASLRRDKNVAKSLLLRIYQGEVVVPLRCKHCKSPSVTPDQQPIALKFMDVPSTENGILVTKNLTCLQCGRITPVDIAKALRRTEIKDLVRNASEVK